MTIKIVSRSSKLALAQVQEFIDVFSIKEYELINIKTRGDILSTQGEVLFDKANFVSDIEKSLIEEKADVDDNRAKDGYEKIQSLFPDVKKFTDFRIMFDKMHKEIDAVIISTPDHTHFAPAMIAMELGKHVYMEKPLAHNVWECRTLKKAAKYYNIVSQMGNQGHTTNGVRQIKEWYEAGILGEVKEVHAWIGTFDFRPGHYWTLPESFPPPNHVFFTS